MACAVHPYTPPCGLPASACLVACLHAGHASPDLAQGMEICRDGETCRARD